jgi:hypothetical protein
VDDSARMRQPMQVLTGFILPLSLRRPPFAGLLTRARTFNYLAKLYGLWRSPDVHYSHSIREGQPERTKKGSRSGSAQAVRRTGPFIR